MAVSEEVGLQPQVSVIIPCYNHGKYLNDALNSVINQSYPSWECIVVNDGSSDNTEELSLQWTKKDSRIKYFFKPNGGLSSARNFGLSKAGGEFIQFLDADDIIAMEKFEKSFNTLSSAKGIIVVSNFTMLDEPSGKILPAYCDLSKIDFSFSTILTGWDDLFTIPIHCALFPAFFFQKVNFDETLKAKEDWMMWLSVFKEYNPKVIYINEALAVYRGSLQSMSNHTISMYENTARAFDIIFKKLIGKDEAEIFFKKVNEFWKKEALFQKNEIDLMNNAKYFQVRKKILNFFSGMGINLKK